MADETLVYTLLGEARGEGVEGMVAVANVIRNRADAGGLFPTDPVDVVLQPYQFSTNNAGEGGNQAQTRREAPVGSPLYNTAARIVELYIEGANPPTDLTGGSLYYHVTGLNWPYANAVTTAYGTTTIGHQTFYPRQPLPRIDIGSIDLLQGGGSAAAAPMPRSRGSRPGGYTQTTAQKIAELRTETRFQQRQTQIKTAMRLALSTASAGSVSDAALSVTPRVPFEGDFTDPNDRIINSITPDRAKLMSRGLDMDMSSTQAREVVLAGGLGSILGKAFPMGPTAADHPVTQQPNVAQRIGGPVPGLRLPVTPETRKPLVPIVRPGDTIAESGLIRRSVKTIKIDPHTGMPSIESEIDLSKPVKVSAAPVGHGAPSARVKQAQQQAKLDKASAPAWTSMGGSPYMTMEERARFARQYAPQTKAKSAPLSAPGANITPAQKAAISGSGAPVPATKTPKAPLPVPKPLTFPQPQPKSSSGGKDYLPASTASLTKIMAPKAAAPASAVKAPVAGLRLPVAPTTRSATVTVTRTVVVHKDGTETAVPKAGSVKMAADKPGSLAKAPVAGLKLPTAPKVTTATVAPQKPTASLSAPGAGLTAAQKAAISGTGAPVPATKPANLTKPAVAPTPVVSTKTITVTKTVKVPVKKSDGGSTVAAKPAAVQTVKGSNGGTYVVGKVYSNGNGNYVANANGTFTKVTSSSGTKSSSSSSSSSTKSSSSSKSSSGPAPGFEKDKNGNPAWMG